MDIAIEMESWRDLFVLLGTSAAALIGLLFIVMTLHIDALEKTAGQNLLATVHGARNNTFHLLTVFVVCAMVLAPQPQVALGLELIAVNLFGLRLPVGFTLKWIGKNINVDGRGGFPVDTILTIAAAYILGAAGGVAELAGMDWSLLAVAGSSVLLVVRTALTAWGLLFGARQATAISQSASTAEPPGAMANTRSSIE